MNGKSVMWTLGVLLVCVMVLLGPFFIIWALNTLFPVLAIGYGIDTWFAAAILAGAIKTTVTTNK